MKNPIKLRTTGKDLSISVNNFNLSYDDVGIGNAPIIFLHGYPFNKSVWKEQLNFLKPAYRIIACDIRGFGKSIDEDSALSIDLFSDDLIAFMDQLRIEKATICGLSMGGFIALNALSRYPERFEALILCDTQCIVDNALVKENLYALIEGIDKNGMTQFNESFLKSIFHSNSMLHKKEVVEKLRRILMHNTSNIIHKGLLALAQRAETWSILDKIGVPTLIICGSEDLLSPRVQYEYMHEIINGSILKVIENAGFVSNVEQANEFNKHLLNFITLKALNANHWQQVQP